MRGFGGNALNGHFAASRIISVRLSSEHVGMVHRASTAGTQDSSQGSIRLSLQTKIQMVVAPRSSKLVFFFSMCNLHWYYPYPYIILNKP